MFETIQLTTEGDVLVATIEHPTSPINAIDATLHHDLRQLFTHLQGVDARAIVLRSGRKAFSAGGDFNWFPELQQPGALEALKEEGKAIFYGLLDVPAPIVCAVGGPAVGLGASIALLSDVLIISQSGMIADPHTQVGIVAGDGGTVAWPLALGPMLAKRYLMTGDPVSADEAFRLGLAAELTTDADLDARAMHWASRLAAGAPAAIRHTKLAVNQWIKAVASTAFEYAVDAEIETFHTADHAEALDAWKDRRPPTFTGD